MARERCFLRGGCDLDLDGLLLIAVLRDALVDDVEAGEERELRERVERADDEDVVRHVVVDFEHLHGHQHGWPDQHLPREPHRPRSANPLRCSGTTNLRMDALSANSTAAAPALLFFVLYVYEQVSLSSSSSIFSLSLSLSPLEFLCSSFH